MRYEIQSNNTKKTNNYICVNDGIPMRALNIYL